MSVGRHNANLEASRDRLIRGGSYKNNSTILICPTRGMIPLKVVQSWLNLMTGMNQGFFRLFVENMEVGEAYSHAVSEILKNPALSKFRYVLTVEEDNILPPDALLNLQAAMDQRTDLGNKPDAVGGLYWTKGMAGQPMIYGDPRERPTNYIPQIPKIDCLQECNGLGMGCTLFRMDMFRDEKIPRPWFKTIQEYKPGEGTRLGTQDLMFFGNAQKAGYRFACDTRVRVGHMDPSTGEVW